MRKETDIMLEAYKVLNRGYLLDHEKITITTSQNDVVEIANDGEKLSLIILQKGSDSKWQH